MSRLHYRANLLERWKFHVHLRRKRFIEALAALPSDTWPRNGWELWAAYKLGMYQTVAGAEWDGHHTAGGIAFAASSAACGHYQTAQDVVGNLVRRGDVVRHLPVLISAIAPFLPETALSILNERRKKLEIPLSFRLALLLKSGKHQLAYDLLQKHVDNADGLFSFAESEPELLLLANNIFLDSTEQQVVRLNAFLTGQHLTPVSLVDPEKPLSVDNIRLEGSHNAPKGPLVSVLMTSYNSAKCVSVALRGLLNQTYQNIEIIIVDDASMDRTSDVAEAIAQDDERVRLIRREVNQGTYIAKTVGFQHARGEFVTCHDSDDWSHPEKLERQIMPLLNNPKLVATTSKWIRLQDNGQYYARLVYPLVRLNPASPLFRREAVARQMGLWDTVRTGADSEFHARLKLVFGQRAIEGLPLLLTLGRHRQDSLMNAVETSYNYQDGARNRLNYWEKWSRAHIRWVRDAGYSRSISPLFLLQERSVPSPE